MSTQRKITVILTDTQYEAIAMAVGHLATALEQDGEGAKDRGTQRALDAGWRRLNSAWHERAHKAATHE